MGTSLIVIPQPLSPKEAKIEAELGQSAQPEHDDLYMVLGISPEIDTPTPTQIRRAYQKAAMKFHPDRHGNSHEAKERFQRIKLAYEVLSDPIKRQFYDDTGFIKPSPAQIASNALDMTHNLFSSAIDAALNENNPQFNINHFDAVDVVKQALRNKIQGIHEERAKQQRNISRLENLQRRFRKKRGDFTATPVSSVIDGKLEHAKRVRTASLVDLEVNEAALKFADEYDCNPIFEQKSSMWFTYPTDGGMFGTSTS